MVSVTVSSQCLRAAMRRPPSRPDKVPNLFAYPTSVREWYGDGVGQDVERVLHGGVQFGNPWQLEEARQKRKSIEGRPRPDHVVEKGVKVEIAISRSEP